MEVRCEANGVECIEIDGSHRLENPDDEATRKHRQVTAELNALRNRLPSLSLVLADSDVEPNTAAHPTFSLPPPCVTTIDVAEKMVDLRRKYPKLSTASYADIDGGRAVYNNEMNEFYNTCEALYTIIRKRDLLQHRLINFDLYLFNSGAGPANDLDVTLDFPEQVTWLAERGSDDARFLREQKFPKPPVKHSGMFFPSVSHFPGIRQGILR